MMKETTNEVFSEAYAEGKAEGLKIGRREGLNQGEMNATLRCIVQLTRKLQISPESTMALLEIPHKMRKSYLKAIQARARQKEKNT